MFIGRVNPTDYIVLGAILEKVNEKSYAELLRTVIIEPLGLHDPAERGAHPPDVGVDAVEGGRVGHDDADSERGEALGGPPVGAVARDDGEVGRERRDPLEVGDEAAQPRLPL